MKMKSLLFGILAILFATTLGVVGCDNAPPSGPQPIRFISTDTSGNTYTLVITVKTSGEAATGDSYELTITNGSTKKVSKGTISNNANGVLTMQPNNSGSGTFTVTANNGQMTNITGTITVEGGGESVNSPGTLTPGGNSGNNGGGAVTNSTFTITGIPAEYNGKYAGISGTVNAGGGTMVYGFQSFNASTGIATLCQISNGSVKIPMNAATSQTTFTKYTGNDLGNINVLVFGSSTVNFPSNDSSLALTTVGFSNVQFTNGGATRAWNGSGNNGGTAPTITTATLPNGTAGTAYNQTLTVTGNTPITWSIESGTLPAGLTITPATGVISGTPTTAGTSTFTVKATNATGSGTKQLSITITTAGGGNMTWTAIVDTSYSVSSRFYLPTSIAYGNGKFVGNDGSSSTDGITWTAGTDSPGGPVIWGNDKFVYASSVKSSAFTKDDSVNAIAYGNGKFVAGGSRYYNGYTSKIVYSSDGVTWTAVTNNPLSTTDIKAIVYGNDKFVSNGATSTDGVTWTAITSDTKPNGQIVYGNGKFVGIGGKISTDGITWTTTNSPLYSTTSIAYGNNKFVATDIYGKIATSTDGSTWTAMDGPFYRNNNTDWTYDQQPAIAFANGKFFITAKRMEGSTIYVKMYWSE